MAARFPSELPDNANRAWRAGEDLATVREIAHRFREDDPTWVRRQLGAADVALVISCVWVVALFVITVLAVIR